MQTETLIIGAGLSGMAIAAQLAAEGRSVHVLEARNRVGGRVLTHVEGGAYFDLGPAWFWPGQPRIARLVEQFGLKRFPQIASGDLVYEDDAGRIQRGLGLASMDGSYRLEGGLDALIRALHDRLPVSSLTQTCKATQISQTTDGIRVETDRGKTWAAKRVVLAVPPRLAAGLVYAPALPENAIKDMLAIPTWMAGQAKVVATYATPFWHSAGLSGDAMSRRGPMVEIHDASTMNLNYPALFGFVGLPFHLRGDEDSLRSASLAQLVRLFGPEAQAPVSLHVKDWAQDPFTATPDDRRPQYTHPTYGLPQSMRGLWNGRLVFAGTEVAPQFGGYLEGALEAAENAIVALNLAKAC